MKRLIKIRNQIIQVLLHRFTIVGVLIVIQFVWFVFSLTKLALYTTGLTLLFHLISLIAVIAVLNLRKNPSYQLAYIILILSFPLLGGAMYLLFSGRIPSRRFRKELEKEEARLWSCVNRDAMVLPNLKQISSQAYGNSHYIENYAKFPAWENSEVKYYSCGEENFPDILAALRSAKHFIFLEYFIIQEGEMWNSILEILKEKAAAGVDVRMIYDDIGSMFVLPGGYDKKMEGFGIQCEAFNRFLPFFSLVMNNRDHRKILVIDGNIGFTGGINLADEYINRKTKYGYWKDSGIMIRGEAVTNLTVMFLSIWNVIRQTRTELFDYLPKKELFSSIEADGFIQPYGDSPLDSETVGENVYLNLIGGAVHYLYIFTPYLIIDNEVMTALCLAAKRGVDVRIVTPDKPDKRLVFWLTQSYYMQLLESGVKIYQYTPGFIHAKIFVCDDCYATVGTINLDYRSLYLHFECGVFLTYCKELFKIKEDALRTMEQSMLITADRAKKKLPIRICQLLLKVFAPIL